MPSAEERSREVADCGSFLSLVVVSDLIYRFSQT